MSFDVNINRNHGVDAYPLFGILGIEWKFVAVAKRRDFATGGRQLEFLNGRASPATRTCRACQLALLYLTAWPAHCPFACEHICTGSQATVGVLLLFRSARNDKRCGIFGGLPEMFDGQTLSGHGLCQHVGRQHENFW